MRFKRSRGASMAERAGPDLRKFQRRQRAAVTAGYAGMGSFFVLCLTMALMVQSGNEHLTGSLMFGIVVGYLAIVWLPIGMFHFVASRCPFCGKSVQIGREWPVVKKECPHCAASLVEPGGG